MISMLLYFIILIFSLNSDISDYREAYKSQDESTILKHLDFLESKSSLSNDEKCYLHSFQCLKAKFSSNPYTKYNSFSKGYKGLNSLISKQSSNVEYRYHRYMVETKAPSFLIENSHVKSDKEYIKKNLKPSHPLYSLIKKTID